MPLLANLGVPRFFAVPDNDRAHSGVMLMNLKELRQSYNDFLAFVVNVEQLLKIDGVDPCSYFEFYEGTSLPARMSWKPHHPERKDVSIVHFLRAELSSRHFCRTLELGM